MKRFNPTLLILFIVVASSCQRTELAPPKDYQTTGSSAHDFLSADVYNSLTIEISYMPGYDQPIASAVDALKVFLNTYIHKPGGINVITKPIDASGKSILTINDISALEKTNRTVFTTGGNLTTHVLLVDADYDKEKILGISYWNTSICLFGKTVWANSTLTTRVQLLSTLMKHEFGHLLGLVNQGSPMQAAHEDPANKAHCNNQNCLMYYTIKVGTSGGTNTALDVNCIEDLRANGGK